VLKTNFRRFNLGSWKICQLMWENFVFLVIFDTFDVIYNWSISLLPPSVLDNLFHIDLPLLVQMLENHRLQSSILSAVSKPFKHICINVYVANIVAIPIFVNLSIPT